MRYIVTKTPHYGDGGAHSYIAKGDAVEILSGPDVDGDLHVRVVESHDAVCVGHSFYVAATCLSPGETLEDAETIPVAAVRAALVAVGVGALSEKVLRIASAIESAR